MLSITTHIRSKPSRGHAAGFQPSQGPRWLPKVMFSALCGVQSHTETVMDPSHMYSCSHMCIQKCVCTHSCVFMATLSGSVAQSQGPGPNTNRKECQGPSCEKAGRQSKLNVEGERVDFHQL